MTPLPSIASSARSSARIRNNKAVLRIFSVNMNAITLGIKFVAAGTVAYFIRLMVGLVKSSGHLRLPPGPKGFPLLGNIRDLPPAGEIEARHWLKHKSLYGASLPPSTLYLLQSMSGISIAEGYRC